MRIHSIGVQNFQRISALQIQPQAPVLMVAGHNEAGKSSLLEAVKIALTNESTRVRLKKDWGEMLRDGAKSGTIAVDLGNDGGASIDLKKWKRESNILDNTLLPILLDPSRFAAMDTAARRNLLFDLMSVEFGGKAVGEKMVERGASIDNVSDVLPMLRSGFPAAMEAAKDKAKEARGAWKATTGETYGSAKAEGWQASIPESNPRRHAELQNTLENLNFDIKALATEIGEAQSTAKAFQALDQIETLQAVADQESELQAHAKSLTERLHTLQSEAPPKPGEACSSHPCPHCGGLTAFVSGKLVEHQENGSTAADTARWEQYRKSVADLNDKISRAEKDLDDARRADARIHEILRQVEGLNDPADIEQMEGRLATLEGERDATQSQLNTEAERIRQAIESEESTEKAAGYHQQVKDWEAIAEMLSPAGIPSEMLQSALAPFNRTLTEVSESTGWDLVQIDPEMEVRVGGRLYGLGSESARWRADAALAYAIASVSELKFFALDRVDVLDLGNRNTCMQWLHSLATDGKLDFCIVLGTFKTAPQLPTDTFHTIWLEAGTVATAQEKAA